MPDRTPFLACDRGVTARILWFMPDEHEVHPDAHPGEIEIEFQHDYQHTMSLSDEHVQEALALNLPANVSGADGGPAYA